MAEWKSILAAAGFIMLCFLGIPMNVKSPADPLLEQEEQRLFHSYVLKFNKPYKSNTTEYALRFKQFQTALKTIEELNKGRDSEESARYGLTEFSDISGEEFLSRRLYRKLGKRLKNRHTEKDNSGEEEEKYHHSKHREHHYHNHIRKRDIPETIPPKKDWRDQNLIGKVRDQKTCGACWAFSTIETVESMFAKTNGTFRELSVQEVIDCAGNGNAGCNGGDTCSLLKWLVMNHIAIKSESEYPLILKDEVCRLSGSELGVEVASNYSCDNFVGNEEGILKLLAFHGPVVAAVNALPWQYYIGGVIQYHCDGAVNNINHAVQIVGYDISSPIPHYIIRNSWGPYFGDNGYAYIAIGGNICGVGTEVSSLDIAQ